jgi:hypothetical protein
MFNTSILAKLFGTHNFKDCIVNATSKWQLCQQAKRGVIGGVDILLAKSPEKSNSILVAIGIEWTANEEMKLRDLRDIFKKKDVKIERGSAWKAIRLADYIENQIKSFIELVEANGLRPQ